MAKNNKKVNVETSEITGPRFIQTVNGVTVVAEFINGECQYITGTGELIKDKSELTQKHSLTEKEAQEIVNEVE